MASNAPRFIREILRLARAGNRNTFGPPEQAERERVRGVLLCLVLRPAVVVLAVDDGAFRRTVTSTNVPQFVGDREEETRRHIDAMAEENDWAAAENTGHRLELRRRKVLQRQYRDACIPEPSDHGIQIDQCPEVQNQLS